MSHMVSGDKYERLEAELADAHSQLESFERALAHADARIADLRERSVVYRVRCERCGGEGKLRRVAFTERCPDCDNGWRLAEGVERYAECCDECHQAEPRYVIPARLIEGDT